MRLLHLFELHNHFNMKQLFLFSYFVSAFTLGGYCQKIQIGQVVPDVVIENVINTGKDRIRLSDFSGKALVIDFWGTTCISCIAVLPKLQSIQQTYKDRLQVITVTKLDTKEKVEHTLQRFKATRDVTLPVAVGDTVLASLFPYQLVSHVVWIDENRVLRAITPSDYIEFYNVDSLLGNRPLHWPVKNDVLSYDRELPFLQLAQPGIVQPTFLHYSLLTGHLAGISPGNGRKVDSVNQTATISFFNVTLLTLVKIALDYRISANQKEFVIDVRDKSRIIKPAGQYTSEWLKENTYSYYITLPAHIDESISEEVVMADLTKWLLVAGIRVSKQWREVPCLVITSIDSNYRLLRSKGGDYLNELQEQDKKLINAPFDVLVSYLNSKATEFPWVVDETGMTTSDRVDVIIDGNAIKGEVQLEKALSKYGLRVTAAKRKRMMYIIEDANVKVSR